MEKIHYPPTSRGLSFQEERINWWNNETITYYNTQPMKHLNDKNRIRWLIMCHWGTISLILIVETSPKGQPNSIQQIVFVVFLGAENQHHSSKVCCIWCVVFVNKNQLMTISFNPLYRYKELLLPCKSNFLILNPFNRTHQGWWYIGCKDQSKVNHTGRKFLLISCLWLETYPIIISLVGFLNNKRKRN